MLNLTNLINLIQTQPWAVAGAAISSVVTALSLFSIFFKIDKKEATKLVACIFILSVSVIIFWVSVQALLEGSQSLNENQSEYIPVSQPQPNNELSAEQYTGSYGAYKKEYFQSAEASSQILREGYNFSVSHVIDGRTDTCWQEDGEGIGVGEWVKLYFEEPTNVDILKFRLGFGDDTKNYWRNSRPSELRIEFSDGQQVIYEFPDKNEDYEIKLSETVSTEWVCLTILDAYDGDTWSDTSIAEVTAYGYNT